MRSFEEQMGEIRRREELQRRRNQRRCVLLYSALSCVCCLALIVAVANILPSLNLKTAAQVPGYYGTVLASGTLGGFAVIVLLAFALGVCVTLLGLKLHKRGGQNRK